jgi:hypothetical protein
MTAITRWSDIPDFADEAAEAHFWENHELDGRLMASSVHEADSRESTTITLRFDPRMLSQADRPVALPELPVDDEAVAGGAA